ncbi:serine protease [Pseudonocardiaceae bacterium YIM PH 21723]|nr:serine protease [Pseudonocardiaceae bacterium YIM PH 21723]
MRRVLTGLIAACLLVPLLASPAGAEPRVVGGSRVSVATFPWVVYLADSNGSQFCGGTLVKPNKVLTAAHCTVNTRAAQIKVVAGRDDKKAKPPVGKPDQPLPGSVSTVKRIWIEPGFTNVEQGRDVSVLTLNTSLGKDTMDLAGAGDGGLYAPGQQATILGWGNTSQSPGSESRYLMGATVPIVSDAQCRQWYPSFKSPEMVCAGYEQGGVDTCQGDSGGPMVVGTKLIGVTSWGDGCAQARKPGVYARVANYADHIQAELAKP